MSLSRYVFTLCILLLISSCVVSQQEVERIVDARFHILERDINDIKKQLPILERDINDIKKHSLESIQDYLDQVAKKIDNDILSTKNELRAEMDEKVKKLENDKIQELQNQVHQIQSAFFEAATQLLVVMLTRLPKDMQQQLREKLNKEELRE